MKSWEDKAERRPISTTTVLVCIVIGIILVIGAGIWALRVATAPVKGAGDAVITKYSEQNWVSAQRGFHQNVNDFAAFKAKMQTTASQLARELKAHPAPNGTPYDPAQDHINSLNSDLNGLSAQCNNTVSSYNTDVAGYLTAGFRDPSLPERLDPADCTPPEAR